MKRIALGMLALIGTLILTAAQAQSTAGCTSLVYTGAPFSSLVTTGPNYSQIVPLTGTVTLAGPLGVNANSAIVTPIAWDFSGEDPAFTSVGQFFLIAGQFTFSTDANGAIIDWNMVLSSQDGGATAERNTLTAASVPAGDSVSDSHNNVGTALGPTSIAGTSNTPGVWSCAPPSPVATMQAQLTAANTQVATLTTRAATLTTMVNSVLAERNAAEAQVAKLSKLDLWQNAELNNALKDYHAANKMIASLQVQIATLKKGAK